MLYIFIHGAATPFFPSGNESQKRFRSQCYGTACTVQMAAIKQEATGRQCPRTRSQHCTGVRNRKHTLFF